MTEAVPEVGTANLGGEWAIVEILGRRVHAGLVTEVERFGAKMVRIDVPIDGDPGGWATHYYNPTAIFSYTPADEAKVRLANSRAAPARLTYPSHDYDYENGDDRDIPF